VREEAEMKAWYFSGDDRRLRHGDGRKIALGVTHEIDGEPELCKHGLHGSIDILDALMYAPGTIVWRVELSGMTEKGDDKIAAQKRTYVAGGIDISDTLYEFARMCALDVIHLWDAPAVAVEYLKTGNESLRAEALSAAWFAAEAAARSAAEAAARSAAWSVAEAAARSAAWSVAEAAVWTAARAAAWFAAEAAARSAAWSVAEAAVWTAARAAVRRKQSLRLLRMVRKALDVK
jgi:hypothetical protein